MKDISGIINRTEIFRNKEFKLYVYNSIVVVKNAKGKIVNFDAGQGADIKDAIKDSLKCIEICGLKQVNLIFNGIEILIHDGIDVRETINNYLPKYDEMQKKLHPKNFIQ